MLCSAMANASPGLSLDKHVLALGDSGNDEDMVSEAAVGIAMGKIATTTQWVTSPRPSNPSTAKLGHAFLNDYLLPFEVGSVVLLAAMIGSVVLARRAVRRDWEKE